MKKFLLVLLVIVMCLSFTGCKKDNEEENEPKEVEVDERIELRKHITIQDVGYVNGTYGSRQTIVKVTNNNDRALFVEVMFDMYDNGNLVNARYVTVRVGAHKSAYAVNELTYEDVKIDSYKYEFDVLTDKLEDYENIYDNMKVSYIDTGSKLDVSITNNGNRTSTVTALILFRNNGSVVAIDKVVEYNLMPLSSKTQSVIYPRISDKKLIPFDRIEVVLNEVSTEL